MAADQSQKGSVIKIYMQLASIKMSLIKVILFLAPNNKFCLLFRCLSNKPGHSVVVKQH